MPMLFWDAETRSTVDLEIAGAYRYAADPSTEVLVAAHAVDDGPVQLWRPGEPIPTPFIEAASDPNWHLAAHNFGFERAIATHILGPRYGWPQVPVAQQICTMAMSLAAALPGGLDAAAAALGLPAKDRDGYRLMMRMARPRRALKGEDKDVLHWVDGPAEREQLGRYCARDTEIERMLFHRLPQLSPAEQTLWQLDAVVNERGFHVDRALAEAARSVAAAEQVAINAAVAEHTDGEITSVDQRDRIVAFVQRHGHTLAALTKRNVAAVLAHEPDDQVRRLLELRQQGARASVRKLDRLLASIDTDDRLRGSLRFHGSSTGRWSGRGYQPQNLKKPETEDLTAAIDAVLSGDMVAIRELGAPLAIAGDVSRSMICAAPGHVLIGGDFSAIEGRVLAWIVSEGWKIATYAEFDHTGDPGLEPYCVTASRILKRTVTPDDEAGRGTGKTAELAFGFGGGAGAWRRFDSTDTYDDAAVEAFKTGWRNEHPATTEFWKAIQRAALQAVHTGQRIEVPGGKLAFAMAGGTLWMTLPSGRRLAYPEARIGPGKFEGHRAVYFHDSARHGWTEVGSWYGLLTENAVQAIARDLLAAAMQRAEAAGYRVVLHVHDELVAEVPENFGSTEEFLRLMTELPDWAAGLPLAAKVWVGPRYAKDGKAAAAKTEPKARPMVAGASKPNGHAAPTEEPENTVSLINLVAEPMTGDRMVRCPFHDDARPSCRIYDDHYHCFACGAHGDTIEWLMQVDGMDRDEAIAFLAQWDGPARPRLLEDDAGASRAYAMQLWTASQPITGTLAERYLRDERRIDVTGLPGDALRFHPSSPFGPGRRLPCLITLLRDPATDAPTGIHRTALTPDARKIDRMVLGRWGVAKLWPAGPRLVVGEGLETVLAAATRITHRGLPLRPAWAALSSGTLGRLPPLRGVEELVLLVDHDGPGRDAAARCRARWNRAGRVILLTPKRTGADFNDIIRAGEPVT